jgi:hypothetical protein
MEDTQGIIAPRSVKNRHSSTTTTMGIIPKEVKGGTSHVHRIKEVITKVISTQTNPP